MGLEGEGEVVVVAMKMDMESKELLNWTLTNVARSKDRIFALHILPNTQDPDGSNPSAIALFERLDSLVSEYGSSCSLKQIDLQFKVCKGSSPRKLLVKETRVLGATKLVLGANLNSYSLLRSSSTSIAKYCAKKLPCSCWVMAVNGGKILFQKNPQPQPQPQPQPSKSNLEARRSPLSRESNGFSSPMNCFSSKRSGFSLESNDFSRESSGFSLERNVISRESSGFSLENSGGFSPKSSDFSSEEEQPPGPVMEVGWPLLRKTFVERKKIALEESKIPVVRWAMQLPNRFQPTPAGEEQEEEQEEEQSNWVGSDSSSPHGDLSILEIGDLTKELESLRDKYGSSCRSFSYEELSTATSNFSPRNFVGKGGSSRVYRGFLFQGGELAVKILKKNAEALREFLKEIEIVTMLHHKNIASLKGFCFENDSLMLVYDYFHLGSLQDALHGVKGETDKLLNWAERYKVAIGVAEALTYLHSVDCNQSVIHRDVKSSNVLLSHDLEPQLSDFGFSARVSASSPYITSSDVAGTFGYLAPEYFMFGKVNEKIDVYAFGVILLELLSGRKPIDNDLPRGKESLVMWAKPILQSEKPKQLLDPKIGSHYDVEQVERMILAAALSIRRTPRTRPKISMILKLLEGDETVAKWARMQVGLCINLEEMYEEEEQEEEEETTVHPSDFQSHLNLALLDVEDDALSVSSTEHCMEHILAQGSLEAYLHGRWSRTSSFD